LKDNIVSVNQLVITRGEGRRKEGKAARIFKLFLIARTTTTTSKGI